MRLMCCRNRRRTDRAMDLQTIEKLLRGKIDTDNRFSLTEAEAAPLGPPVRSLYSAYFNGGPFRIANASLSMMSSPDRVALIGTGGSFPFDGVPVRAYFTISTTNPSDAALE